jgi:hypothetical protein
MLSNITKPGVEVEVVRQTFGFWPPKADPTFES